MYLSRRRCLLAALNTEPHPLNLSLALSRSRSLALSLTLSLSLSLARSLLLALFLFLHPDFFFSWQPLWERIFQLTTTYMIYMLTSFSSTNYYFS